MNLRSGPGTNFGRVGQVGRGQKLPITGRNQNSSWFQITTPDGKSAWVINDDRWTRSLGDTSVVPVAQNIPTPPPTPRPQPTSKPAPTNTPVPSFAFQASGPISSPTSNSFLNIFGAVQDQGGAWLAGYQLKATRNGGDAGLSEPSRPGYSDASNPGAGDNQHQNMKYEYSDQSAADWEVWLVDGGGTQVSNSIRFSTNPGALQWHFITFKLK